MFVPTVTDPPGQMSIFCVEDVGKVRITLVVTILSHSLELVKLSVKVPAVVYVLDPTITDPPGQNETS